MWDIKLKKKNIKTKTIENHLKTIWGIKNKRVKELLNNCGISVSSKIVGKDSRSIKERHLEKLYLKLNELRNSGLIDDRLMEEFKESIEKKKKLGTWSSLRHRRRLPLKGRTRSNSKTRNNWKGGFSSYT